MSSCLSGGGGGRTYGFDLDLMKSPSPSSTRSSSSSSPSSTLSESCISISTKRARTPRKRPNQSYTEAAALLSTIYPNLFSSKNLHKPYKHSKPFNSPFSDSSSDLLPPFPVLNEAGFLIQDPSPHQKPTFRFEFKPACPMEKSCAVFQEPGSPDYDVESILDEEVGEGIDSIMGNLSMKNCDYYSNSNSDINPCFGSLMGFGFGGKFELGLGCGLNRNNIRQALRGAHDGVWWRSTATVAMRDIVPKFNALPPLEKKKKTKKKKKVEKAEVKNSEVIAATTTNSSSTTPSEGDLNSGLGLKLNHEEVLKAWSDRGFPFFNESGSPESSADSLARLAEIDLFPDTASEGVRETSVLRYKEKRRTRLFSKKIRYQVRKVNADRRPRMKGRFVRRPSLLHQAIEEESDENLE